jgi:hypothetical protein
MCGGRRSGHWWSWSHCVLWCSQVTYPARAEDRADWAATWGSHCDAGYWRQRACGMYWHDQQNQLCCHKYSESQLTKVCSWNWFFRFKMVILWKDVRVGDLLGQSTKCLSGTQFCSCLYVLYHHCLAFTPRPSTDWYSFDALHNPPRVPGCLLVKPESGWELCTALVELPPPTSSYSYCQYCW